MFLRSFNNRKIFLNQLYCISNVQDFLKFFQKNSKSKKIFTFFKNFLS